MLEPRVYRWPSDKPLPPTEDCFADIFLTRFGATRGLTAVRRFANRSGNEVIQAFREYRVGDVEIAWRHLDGDVIGLRCAVISALAVALAPDGNDPLDIMHEAQVEFPAVYL